MLKTHVSNNLGLYLQFCGKYFYNKGKYFDNRGKYFIDRGTYFHNRGFDNSRKQNHKILKQGPWHGIQLDPLLIQPVARVGNNFTFNFSVLFGQATIFVGNNFTQNCSSFGPLHWFTPSNFLTQSTINLLPG